MPNPSPPAPTLGAPTPDQPVDPADSGAVVVPPVVLPPAEKPAGTPWPPAILRGLLGVAMSEAAQAAACHGDRPHFVTGMRIASHVSDDFLGTAAWAFHADLAQVVAVAGWLQRPLRRAPVQLVTVLQRWQRLAATQRAQAVEQLADPAAAVSSDYWRDLKALAETHEQALEAALAWLATLPQPHQKTRRAKAAR